MLTDLVRFVILIGGIQGVVLGLIHLVKRPRFVWDLPMALLLLTFASGNLFLWLLGWHSPMPLSEFQLLPLRVVLLLPLNLVLLPIFFLLTYVKRFVNAELAYPWLTKALKWTGLAELLGHLLPFGAAIYLASVDKELVHYALSIKQLANLLSIPFAVTTMAAIRQLSRQYRQQRSQLSGSLPAYRAEWVQTLYYAFIGIYTLVAFPLFYPLFFESPGSWLYFPQGIGATLALFWISLQSVLIDARVASEGVPVTASQADLPQPAATPSAQGRIYQELLRLLQAEQLYKNPHLKLSHLAQRLDLSPNYLSRIINQQAHKNFNDLLNEHRVEEVKEYFCQTGPILQHPGATTANSQSDWGRSTSATH